MDSDLPQSSDLTQKGYFTQKHLNSKLQQGIKLAQPTLPYLSMPVTNTIIMCIYTVPAFRCTSVTVADSLYIHYTPLSADGRVPVTSEHEHCDN